MAAAAVASVRAARCDLLSTIGSGSTERSTMAKPSVMTQFATSDWLQWKRNAAPASRCARSRSPTAFTRFSDASVGSWLGA